MCRWLAYRGNPIYLERLLFEPEHSLIDQSLAAQHSTTTTNGDGFGVGWYGERPEPGLFKDVRPAWNDPNLKDLAAHIHTHLFFAHVRATTGSEVQRSNCHPFRHGRWLFMHNGAIQQFERIKRDLALVIDEELYPCVLGTTDTEVMFFLALTFGLDREPVTAIERMVGFVEGIAEKRGIENAVQMTICASDGERIYAFRYATAEEPRTLFVSRDIRCLEELNPQIGDFGPDARAVVSEPFGGLSDAWETVPPASTVVVRGPEVEIRPFEPTAP